MPSSISFANAAPAKTSTQSIYNRPQKKQRMSVTQTYFLAHSARGKLSREASRPDHNLRLLVGHANMLDSLMLDLANAEQEQERWFNKSLSGAREESEPVETHIEAIPETEAEWEAENNDGESDLDDEDQEMFGAKAEIFEIDSDLEEDDEDDADLVLTRTASRYSPPELSADADSDSEDDDAHMPPSPPQTSLITFTEKERQAIATTTFYDSKDSSMTPEYFLPSRQQPTIIAAV